MSMNEEPGSWRDPDYLSTIAGVIATGTLVFYSALVDSAPSIETIIFVLLWVLIPVAVTYEAAKRLL